MKQLDKFQFFKSWNCLMSGRADQLALVRPYARIRRWFIVFNWIQILMLICNIQMKNVKWYVEVCVSISFFHFRVFSQGSYFYRFKIKNKGSLIFSIASTLVYIFISLFLFFSAIFFLEENNRKNRFKLNGRAENKRKGIMCTYCVKASHENVFKTH